MEEHPIVNSREQSEIDPEAVAKVRGAELSGQTIELLNRLFSAVADPTRLRILHALTQVEEMCVGDLSLITDLSVSAVSHQLRLLRDRQLVRARRDGRIVYYSLLCPHIAQLMVAGVEHTEEIGTRWPME